MSVCEVQSGGGVKGIGVIILQPNWRTNFS